MSWDQEPETGREAGQEQSPGTGGEQRDDAVEVLRAVWSASGQTSADLEELFGPAKSCKSMRDVGFDAMAGETGDVRGAWRATLQREGKLSEGHGTVRDLVLGSAEPGER